MGAKQIMLNMSDELNDQSLSRQGQDSKDDIPEGIYSGVVQPRKTSEARYQLFADELRTKPKTA